MKALVTGATGFVGSAVARVLLSAGWQVRVLARAGSDRSNLSALAVEVAQGDLAHVASLERALDGCEALFHVAADYRLGARDPSQLYLTNVEGTRNILAACQRAGVARVIYTSSVATIGIPTDGSPGEELTPVAIGNMIGHYKRSKFLAEEVARDAARSGMSVIIVNPSTPVGPGDIKPTPTGRLVLDAASGRMPAYVDTGLNIAHVDDIAAGHLLAFERGTSGERYILGGENMSLRDILAQISRLVGRKPPGIRLPYAAVLPVAYAAEAIAKVIGRSGRVTLEGVRMSRKCMFFSSAKAVNELGYRWRPPIEAFADAVRWFRERGLLS
ncbi:MAG: NAD-dependent epimerase/dehydratase family protein [Pseudomonadota bacterium]|nr:NAD-dependent epimerase/dehydratase family protein [Pseudomonadota bacterium]